MGRQGTWQLANTYPAWVAEIAPIHGLYVKPDPKKFKRFRSGCRSETHNDPILFKRFLRLKRTFNLNMHFMRYFAYPQLIIAAFFLIAGCSSPTGNIKQYPEKTNSETLDKDFVGTWIVENSSAEFEIQFSQEKVYLIGRDSEDREEFEVSGLSWTTSTIKGTIFVPSTSTRIHIELTIQNKNTIKCQFGDSSSEVTIWKRMGKK